MSVDVNFMRAILREFFTELFHGSENSGDLQPRPIGVVTYSASVIINVLTLALPLTILQVYDRVLPNAALETLGALIILLSAAILVDGMLKHFRSLIINWSSASYTHNLSVRAISSMLAERPAHFSKTTTSEHLERLNAISGLGAHYSGQSRTVLVDILFIPIFSLVIVLVGGVLFGAIVVLFAIFGYLGLKSTKSLNAIVSERETFDARKQDFVIEVLRAIQTVKAHAMEPQIMRRFERLQSAASAVTRRMITQTGTAQMYNNVYASLSTVVIVTSGAVLVINDRLTLGALACCMLLSSQLLQPLMRSLVSWNEIKLAQHRRNRVDSIFEASQAKPLAEKPFPERFKPKSVSLRNLTIQHGDAAPLFNNLNLDIRAGEFVAFTGSDGCGRSSLLRALVQDAPVVHGEIEIDDHIYKLDTPNTARQYVSYVGQNPVIFRGSIIENITLFGETPTKIALSAARFTGLDEEVSRLPLGYDTLLKSAAGRDIPAPTAQRITLTRVLAMRPSVLILDEANTLLDMASEQKFIDSLSRLHGSVTTIIATHRPSLLQLADRVFEIRDGDLVLKSDCQQDRKRLAQ